MTGPDHELLEKLGAHIPESGTVAKPSSAPCLMADTDPAYHGFTPLDTLVERLNTLLEAERAGALVCAKSLEQAPDEATRALLQRLREDETRSCRGLLHSLKELGATPSRDIGAFHDKAMAIADLAERLRFVERGQSWVARHIDEWLPGVAHPAVHAQLSAMRDDHLNGIAALQQHNRP